MLGKDETETIPWLDYRFERFERFDYSKHSCLSSNVYEIVKSKREGGKNMISSQPFFIFKFSKPLEIK